MARHEGKLEIGDKYIFIDDFGECVKRTWICSTLDIFRYLSNNVYCPETGFPMVNEKKKLALLNTLFPTEKERLLNMISKEKHEKTII